MGDCPSRFGGDGPRTARWAVERGAVSSAPDRPNYPLAGASDATPPSLGAPVSGRGPESCDEEASGFGAVPVSGLGSGGPAPGAVGKGGKGSAGVY
jgi:hypothetical protein